MVRGHSECQAFLQPYRTMGYTWRDCFVKSMREVKPTDLIEHSIDLTSDAKPVYASITRYTPKEKEFAARIFSECEVTGWAYVLLVIDYISRFVWTNGCVAVDQEAMHEFWVKFGWPEWLYTENASRFVGLETVSLFESYRTYISQTSISYSSSVALVERNV